MTTATATEVSKRRAPGARGRRTPFSELAAIAGAHARRVDTLAWPSDKYRDDPCGFAREVLGVKLWSKQVEILEAIRDHKRVAIKSGHKISKSYTLAVAALWFFCSFPDARVVMSSVTSRQVDAILWRELRKIRARATVAIDGDMHELARSGFKAADFREIVGFTAREAEAVAGISGANLLYLLDEASGIGDDIFEAIEGNRAGGARVVMTSNPTRTEGEFFEAFTSKAHLYHTISVSSEETPNAVEGVEVIPGLAGREWIDEKRLEWGSVDAASGEFVPGPLYKVRVLGDFVTNEAGRILSLHAIQQAEERWADASDEGRLHIGVDPAGPGLGGDETSFAIRRGVKVLGLVVRRGLTDDAHLVELLGVIAEHRRPRDPLPIVVLDREGPIGGTIYGIFRGAAERNGFEVCGVRSSERAIRNKDKFERVRDELWWNLYEWIRDGGAIPEDAKLSRELHAPMWEETINGKAKATGKSELRKILERSPDRADSVALAVWTPSTFASTVPTAKPEASAPKPYHGHAAPLSPYQAQNAFRRGR